MRHDHPMDRLHTHLDGLVAAHDSIDQAADRHAEAHHAHRHAEAERIAADAAVAREEVARHG